MKLMRRILSISLIIIGIGIMLQHPIRDFIVRQNTNRLLEVSMEEIAENREREVMIDFTDVREVTTGSIMGSMNASGIYTIGRIKIESVGLDLPILNVLNDAAMHKGAAIMTHDQIMGQGNYSLSSHNMRNPDLLFSPLHRVNIGDEIVISDDTGSFTYIVTGLEIIPPTSTYALNEVEGKTLITLITCTDDGENRLVVRGELI